MSENLQAVDIERRTGPKSFLPSRKSDQARGAQPGGHRRRPRRRGFRLSLRDGRPVSRDDRRRLRAGRLHDGRAEGVRLHRRRAGARQPAGQGRPGAGPHRRPRLPGRARPGARQRRGRRRRDPQHRRAARAAAVGDRPGRGDHRRHPSLAEIRGGRTMPATATW